MDDESLRCLCLKFNKIIYLLEKQSDSLIHIKTLIGQKTQPVSSYDIKFNEEIIVDDHHSFFHGYIGRALKLVTGTTGDQGIMLSFKTSDGSNTTSEFYSHQIVKLKKD